MKLTNENFRAQTPQVEAGKKLNIAAWIVTVVVLLLVLFMHRISLDLPEGITLNSIPFVNAIINTGVAIALILAIIFVKQGNYIAHRNVMSVALTLSVLFLLLYVAYHLTHEDIKYGDINYDGILSDNERASVSSSRTPYLILLISHIVLAAVSFPFILFTFIRAFTNQFRAHVKMARWVYWLWLYVAVTGPIVYLLLRPYYPF